MFFIGAMCLTCISVFAKDYKIPIPEKIEHKGKTYTYKPRLKDRKIIAEGNIDSESDKEVIIIFGAYEGNDKAKKPAYFLQVYKFKADTMVYKKVKTIKLEDYPKEIILKDFNRNDSNELAVLCLRKRHYEHIYIYQFQQDDFNLIWDRGSYCGVEISFNTTESIIKVASSNFGAKLKDKQGQEIYWCYAAEPLWEVYGWDGNTFIYREDLSTAKPLEKLR